MKRTLTLSLILALFGVAPAVGHAQTSGLPSGGVKAAQPAPATVHKGVGVVRKIDPAKNSITLAHERIASLNWPPMVMAFTVKDKSLLDKAQAGKKVEFEFVQQGRDNVITSVK